MNREIIKKIDEKYQKNRPNIQVGDTVVVDTVIRDGGKTRVQKFKGIVLAIKGQGLSKTFTVRKISYGIGVEKIFPFHSPNVSSIEIVKHSNVKQAKLYYMRDRIGKAATNLKAGKEVTEEENAIPVEESTEEKSEESAEAEAKS